MLHNRRSQLKFKNADISDAMKFLWEGEFQNTGVGMYVCARGGGAPHTRWEQGYSSNCYHLAHALSQGSTYITPLNPHNSSVKDMLWWLLLKMRKRRCKELNYHIQGHQLINGRLGIQTQVCQAMKSSVLATKHQCLSCLEPQLDSLGGKVKCRHQRLVKKNGFHLQTWVKSVASNKG